MILKQGMPWSVMIGKLHRQRFRLWWFRLYADEYEQAEELLLISDTPIPTPTHWGRPMGRFVELGTVSRHLSTWAYSRLRERLYSPWEQGYWFHCGVWYLQHPDEVFPPEHDESI